MADSPDLVHRGVAQVGTLIDWQEQAARLARDLERVTAELRDASERVYVQRELIAQDIAHRREHELAAFRAGYLHLRARQVNAALDRGAEEYIERAFHAWKLDAPL